MAVALRAYTQGTSQGSGSVSIAWPTGTAAGDLAVLVAQDYGTNGPTTSGWTAIGRGVWYKRVTTADIAAPLPVKGRTTFLQTFTGADKIGTWRNSEGLTLTKAGAGLFVDGWGPSRISNITPGSTNRLGNEIRLTTDNTPNAVWFIAASTTGYKALTDHDDDCSYVSYEILPVAGPNAPTLILPAAGSGVDNGSPIVFSWLHNSQSGATQEAAQIRVRIVGAGTWSYVQAAGTITTTVTTLTQSAMTASINAGVLTTGQNYEYQIATQDYGVLGAFSATRTFMPVIPPTVDSITPTSTAGSLTPTIAWTRTANVGSPEAWQVRISASTDTTSDTPIWDSQVTSGNATQTIAPATAPWVNGQTLYAWVRVMQTGGLWSPWTKDNATFTVSWTPPTAPSSVTPANVANAPLQVTIAGVTVGYGAYLQMSYDGTTWTDVETNYDHAGTSVVMDVPLAAYGAAATYRARTSNVISGVTLYSSWTTSSALATTDKGSYFVDDTNEYIPIDIREEQGPTLVQGITISYGHGATKAFQDQTAPQGLTGALTLYTADIVDEYTLREWLTTKGVWTTRWVPERNPGSGTLFRLNTRMALAKAAAVTHVIQTAHAARTITFEWVEQ